MLDADVADLDVVIVTHDHADHCHGIDDLRQVAQHMGHPVPLHARPDTLRRLGKRFAYAFEGTPLYPAVLDAKLVEENVLLGDATLRSSTSRTAGSPRSASAWRRGVGPLAMRSISMS